MQGWYQVDPKAEYLYSMSPYQAMGNNPILYNDPNGDFIPQLVGAVVGGTVNLVDQALKGNVTSLGEGLAYFGTGAAAGVAVSFGQVGAARAITVVGNKGVQIATGKFSFSDLDSPGDYASLALDVGTDFLSPGLTQAISKPLTKALTPLAQRAVTQGIGSATVTGGGNIVKVGGALDDIAFSAGFTDEFVVTASRITGNSATKLLPAAGQAGRLLKFTGDEAVQHFGRHSDQVMKVLGRDSYNLAQYVGDANRVIQNGTYLPKMNAYVQRIPNTNKVLFTGLKNGGRNISTFGPRTIKGKLKQALLNGGL